MASFSNSALANPQTHATATALAGLPLEIRGFGHVKQANYEKPLTRQGELLAALDDPSRVPLAAE